VRIAATRHGQQVADTRHAARYDSLILSAEAEVADEEEAEKEAVTA